LRAAARERGARRAYLQVEVDNLPALRLYDGLGFQPSHDYHYRSEGSDAAQGC
jgi:ribosomal protein S18 acetylase RimI-like enzyme